MSKQYTREHLKLSIAKILQTLGWNTINTNPLEILTDILNEYMTQMTRSLNGYANEFGCTQSNLDHLGLTFRDMGISIAELEEYVKYVNFGPPPHAVPKYPIPKDDHLNFLKPGSKEVVTRPVHIPEHLPPMNPLLEETKGEVESVACKVEEPEEASSENLQVFKKPVDVSPSEFKRPSFRREEEGSRPTREISSVMMTTSGFLSPAREGKLPESRTPITSVEPTSPASQTSETVDLNKKPKIMKKIEKKKAKLSSGPGLGSGPTQSPAIDQVGEEKKKKINSMKWMLKSKQQQQQPHQHQQLPSQLQKLQNKMQSSLPQNNEVNISPVQKTNQHIKDSKALAAARLKTEKLNTTITPVTVRPVNNPPIFPMDHDNVDKLFTEPDKKKVNIFKKISNVKNERADFKVGKKDDIKQESRESSPDLIIDEPDEVISKLTHISTDVTIEPISPMISNKSPDKAETPYFDDDSQPGTPLTPKTPEMISHSPPVIKEKRKRKESKKVKKIPRIQSPHRLDSDAMDIDMERPKTPEPHVLSKLELPMPVPLPTHPPTMGGMPFFNFGGPGLIPSNNPFIPNLPFPPMMYNFGQKSPLSTFHQKISEPSPLPPTPIPQDVHVSEELPASQRLLPEKPPVMGEMDLDMSPSSKSEKKSKEHKRDKKDKIKKRNKKDKIKNKAEKKKLKEEKREKIKKEKKEKRNKDKEIRDSDSPGVKITLKLKSPSPRPETPETRKLYIKPFPKKEDVINSEERIKRETSPGLAKISALVCGPPKPKPVNPPKSVPPAEDTTPEELPITPTPRTGPGPGRPRIHPIKPKPSKPKKRRQPVKKDAEGNEVWICPGCGNQDDGSPMIGCDGCDAWYHWVCVGIQVPPDDSEDWYCRHCLLKKNEDLQSDKQKKKRKKKEKKEH